MGMQQSWRLLFLWQAGYYFGKDGNLKHIYIEMNIYAYKIIRKILPNTLQDIDHQCLLGARAI